LVAAVRSAGFDRVAIDARGFRSGSLNVLGGVVAEPLVRATSSPGEGDAGPLAHALRALNLECDVEARARLAIVRLEGATHGEAVRDATLRERIADIARSQGFTHVAIEVLPADDAAVRRD
jgi:hypothetical protein